MYTGLSWTPSPAEAKPNFSQLHLSRLSLVKPAKLNFFKTSASGSWGGSRLVPYIFMANQPAIVDGRGPCECLL